MVKITKISVQKRNKERYNIFLDRGQGEEYAFSVDQDLLIKHRLKKGLELDEKQLMKLLDEDEQKKAYHLSIHFLSYRMRSIEEMRAYLLKKDKEERHIEAVILQLINHQLLNDVDFANAFIRTKKATSVNGPIKLKQELRQKGVDVLIIDAALEQFSISEQKAQLIKWLDRQKKRNQRQSNKAFSDKLVNQLQSRGYSRQVITDAMKEVDLVKGVSEEWEAICYQGQKATRKYKGKYEGWEYKQRMKQDLYRRGFSIDLIDKFLDQSEIEESSCDSQ